MDDTHVWKGLFFLLVRELPCQGHTCIMGLHLVIYLLFKVVGIRFIFFLIVTGYVEELALPRPLGHALWVRFTALRGQAVSRTTSIGPRVSITGAPAITSSMASVCLLLPAA